MQKYKELYDALNESGELQMFFPELKGDWEKDSRKFVKLQEDLENSLELDVEIDTDDE